MARAKWKCGVCSFIWDGDEPPDTCPRCGAPKESFTRVPEEKVKLIERSRLSNTLHLRLFALMEEVVRVAEAGIEDNLDPLCLSLFTKARDDARAIQQMAMAEIEVHVGKGKWG
ncbi:MAG: rubredoxin-like domain-containing protein [Candidatus Bathyarchaeia archaeon]